MDVRGSVALHFPACLGILPLIVRLFERLKDSARSVPPDFRLFQDREKVFGNCSYSVCLEVFFFVCFVF